MKFERIIGRGRIGASLGGLLLAMALALGAAGCAVKANPAVVIVTPSEAEQMAKTGKVKVIATAPTGGEASFAGADTISIPYTAPVDAKRVGESKTTPILVLGNAPGKTQGLKVANSLVDAGYREVHYLPR